MIGYINSSKYFGLTSSTIQNTSVYTQGPVLTHNIVGMKIILWSNWALLITSVDELTPRCWLKWCVGSRGEGFGFGSMLPLGLRFESSCVQKFLRAIIDWKNFPWNY